MVKRKERSLEKLYKLHKKIAKPRLTPILEGICRIQGPVDELDSEIENDLEDSKGKLSIGSSAKKINNCMNARKDSANDNNTENLFMTDAAERENTEVSMKERSHENKAMADSVDISLEFDHKEEKEESVCILEEKGVVSKVVDASQSCQGETSIKEEAEEDCEKCSTSEKLQTILQGCSTPCKSVQDFIFDSTLDSKMQVDLNQEVLSAKDNNVTEIDKLRDTGPHKTLNKKDTDMPSNTLTSIRDQTENKSIELLQKPFCMSPDLAPSAHFVTQLDSYQHKERLSEISTKGESCNVHFGKTNLVFPGYKTPEEVFDVTDGFTKLPEEVVDNSHGCLKEVSSVDIKMGNICRIENSSDVTDEVNPLSVQETLFLQDNNMPICISGNTNIEITSAHAKAVTMTKEVEQHYGYQQGKGSTFPFSEHLVIRRPQENIASLSSHISEAQSTKHSGAQQEGSTFRSSGQPVISTTQENVVSLSSHLSDSQSAKHPQDGCVIANCVPGSLSMEDVQPLEENSKSINVLPVDVTQDFLGASDQPSPMLLDESLSTEDAENKMHLYENSNIDRMDIETSKMKVSSDPLSEDNDLELDDVKVCDICGDAGLEDKLAICSMCNDGAEHIYCMQVMLDKVPEGNWLCECCKSSQNAALKKVEKTLNVISRSTSLSTKKQSSNDSFHSRPFGKTDKKRSDLEIKKMKATLSSLSSMKRRAEDFEVGPSSKKHAIEVRNVQHISNSNLKHVPSRENSFKSTDTGRIGQSISGASLGNYTSANIGKSLSAMGSQSPRHGGGQLLKSRFTSVNSLASDSSQFSAATSNVASDRVVLSSKSPDIRPSSSFSSKSSNNPKLIAITKNKKDLGSGGFNKIINDSLFSKSKGSTTVSNNIETRTMSVQSATQAKEIKIVKLRKDETDSMTKKSVVKAGNTASDLMSGGGVSFPLCSKPAVNDTSVNQGPIKLGSLVKDICKSKLTAPEQNSIIGPSPMEENTKEECSCTIISGGSVPTFTSPINVSNIGSMKIKSEPLATPGGFYCSESQTSSQKCNSELSSGQNLMQIQGTFCDPTGSTGCNIANDKPVNISLQDSQSSKIDEKSKNFSSSWTRNILASIASTRCYKCKELGHTAQFCTNRSSASTGPTSLRVSTLRHSAAKMSREMAESSSGKCNNPLETIVPGDMNACENDQTSEQRPLFSEKQEQEAHTEYNFHGDDSDDSVFPSSIEPSSCRKPDGESSVSGEFPLLNSGLGRNFSTITPDLPLGLCKDSEVYCSSITTSLGKELPSTTSTKIITKWNNAQIYPSQKLYVDGEAFISLEDHCKVAPTASVAQCTVYPIESTVTAVKRNTSSELPVISNGNYPTTCMRVLPHGNFPYSENLKISAFPEHNFLWQGGFEVRSKGNPTNYYDGLQAHASTCAALKVLDAAKKFSSLIPFEEVPRLSTWPMQFQYCSPTDENIALYFFAKDRQSYEGDYRNLLKHMRKNDFALRANFDGVELLIFPSTQLPDKSQCWNKLLYLWGVFRERKANCIVSHAFPQDMIHEQLSTSVSTVGKLNSKVATRALPSLPLVGFSLERVDMDIDIEGSQEGSSIERALSGLERTKSQISPFSLVSLTQDEGRSKGPNINMMDFDEQKLSSIHKNDELLGKDKPSLKNDSSKYSSESGLYSKASYLNKEKKNTLDTSDGKIVDSQTLGQSVISQISSWRERAHSACPGYVSFSQEKKNTLDTSDGNIVDSQTFGQSVISQISSWRERALSACPSYLSSALCAVSSCSVERHDNPQDSSKVSQVSLHAQGQQTHGEKERSKSKEDENDRGRERAKELEYSSFRGKDSGHKEWKLRDRENEREKERNGEIASEKDRRNLSRRHEEYSSHESLLRRDSKEERRHHFSHSPTRHGSRLYSLPMRMNNYDQHHSRVRSPDYDQNRHSQPSSGVEVCGSSRRKDTVFPKGRSFSDFLVDDKGQRKLKKSYSDIYVREIYREQDFSGRSTSNRSSSEMSTCSQTQQVRDLPASLQASRSSSLEHIHHDSKEYHLSLPKDFQVTERFCFPEPRNTQINDKTTKASEQLSVKTMSKQKSVDLSDDQCIPSVENVREPPDLNVPDLELALGAKISSPKEGVLPSFVPLLDKTSIQQRIPSPRMNEVGSSLSLSLTFPLPQKEQAAKTVLKEKEVMPDNACILETM